MKKVYYRNDYHENETVLITLDNKPIANIQRINFELTDHWSLKLYIDIIRRTHKISGLIKLRETLLKNILYN